MYNVHANIVPSVKQFNGSISNLTWLHHRCYRYTPYLIRSKPPMKPLLQRILHSLGHTSDCWRVMENFFLISLLGWRHSSSCWQNKFMVVRMPSSSLRTLTSLVHFDSKLIACLCIWHWGSTCTQDARWLGETNRLCFLHSKLSREKVFPRSVLHFWHQTLLLIHVQALVHSCYGRWSEADLTSWVSRICQCVGVHCKLQEDRCTCKCWRSQSLTLAWWASCVIVA